jgi:glutathione S-transferase
MTSTPVTIKLYNFSFGPYPQRLNIYLDEKKPGNLETIIFDEPDKQAGVPPPEIKALAITGSIPVLVDDDGTIIGQSPAILEYLVDKTSGPDILGATPSARGRTRQFVHMFDEVLTFFGLWALHGSQLGYGLVRTSPEVAEICAARYFAQLRLIERMIGEAAFLAGDQVTTAGRCCRTLSAEDSHHESMRLDGRHDQAIARPLPYDELVQLHSIASHARFAAYLAG